MKKSLVTVVLLHTLSILLGQNVGIGTSNPGYLLHLNGGDLFVQASSGLIRFGYQGSNEWQMATTNGGADLRWYTTTDGGVSKISRHYFSQNGNVGIGGFSGTEEPHARLELIGENNSSGTNLLILRNLNGDTLLRFSNDGRAGWGFKGPTFGRTLNLGGNGINFYTSTGNFGGAIFPTNNSLVIWSGIGANHYLVLQPELLGNAGVGTYTPNAKFHVNGAMLIGGNLARIAVGYSLSVDGKIMCEDVQILPSDSWPDYVFDDQYPLLPLDELEKIIKQQKHLPNIPSAAEVNTNRSFSLGEMNRKLLEKVEELTLYIIQMNKDKKELDERVSKLESKKY